MDLVQTSHSRLFESLDYGVCNPNGKQKNTAGKRGALHMKIVWP